MIARPLWRPPACLHARARSCRLAPISATSTTSSWLGPLPSPHLSPHAVRSQYNAASLAFLGDAVWEAFIRQHHWDPSSSLHGYNQAAKAHASAAAQAVYYDRLVGAHKAAAAPARQPRRAAAAAKTSNPIRRIGAPSRTQKASTPDPADTPTTGAAGDGSGGAPAVPVLLLSDEEVGLLRWARNSSTVSAPRGMDALQYKKATALEGLVAFLYLTDPERCRELVQSLVGPATAPG